jgi:hypothetical protein
VSIDMSAALAAARAPFERTLTDTVTVERQDGYTTGPLGQRTPAWATTYTGPGLVQRDGQQRGGGGVTIVLDQAAEVAGYVVKVPVSVDIAAQDRATVTASLTPGMVGRAFAITEAPLQGWAVLRRCTADPA